MEFVIYIHILKSFSDELLLIYIVALGRNCSPNFIYFFFTKVRFIFF